MGLFKNGVGRPSNEIIRKRKIAYFLLFASIACFIGYSVSFITNAFNNLNVKSKEKNATSIVVSAVKSGDVASEIILGGDKKITIEDLSIIQRLAAGEKINGKTKDTLLKSGTKSKLADINGDGKVDENDIEILSYFVTEINNITNSIIKDVSLGDINKNGSLDEEDVELLKKYINESDKYLSESQIKIADITSDGKVDNKDIEFLSKFVVKRGNYKLGDANQDGKLNSLDTDMILKYSIKDPAPNSTQLLLSDLDEDGVIKAADSRLLKIILNTGKSYVLGDVNKNGTIDSKDLDLLKKYLNKKSTPTAIQLDLGDINRDGKLTTLDSTILERYIAGYGDVVNAYNSKGDGKLTIEDFELIKNNNGVKVSTTTSEPTKLLSELLAKEFVGLTSVQKSAADIDGNGTITAADANKMFDMKNNKFSTNGAKVNGVTATYDKNTQVLTLSGTATGNVNLMSLLGQKFVEKEQYKITLTYVSGTVEGSSSTFTTQILKKDNKTLSTGNVVNLSFPTSKTKETSKVMNINLDGAKTGTQLNSLIKKSGNLKFTNYKVKVNIVNASLLTVIFEPNGSQGERKILTCNKLDKTSCEASLPNINPKDMFKVLGWSTNKYSTKAEIDTTMDYLNLKKATPSENSVYYAITESILQNNATFIKLSTLYGDQEEEITINCYKYNGAYSCPIKAPTFKLKNGLTAIGWYEMRKNPIIPSIKVNEKVDIKNIDMSFYNVAKKVITVKFNKNTADSLSFDEEQCSVYSGEIGCFLTIAPNIYSKGNETIYGFFSNKNGRSSNINNGNILNVKFEDSVTLYSIIKKYKRTSKLNISETKYIGGISFDIENGTNKTYVQSSLKYITDALYKLPFLFKTSGKVTLMTPSTYDKIWSPLSLGMTYFSIDGGEEFANADVKIEYLGSEQYIIHEMAHQYDMYYGGKYGKDITLRDDLKSVYKKYYNLASNIRPLTGYAYSTGDLQKQPSEFWAEAVLAYYYEFYRPDSSVSGNRITKDICQIVEKYGEIPSSESKCGILDNTFTAKNYKDNNIDIKYDNIEQTLTINGSLKDICPLSLIRGFNFTKGNQYKITLTYVSGSVTNAGTLTFITDVYNENIQSSGISSSLTMPIKTGSATKTLSLSKNVPGGSLYINMKSTSNNIKFNNYKVKVNITKIK